MFATWWRDGSQWELFREDEVEKFAERYSFNGSDLLFFREVTFTDDSECVIGGVMEL